MRSASNLVVFFHPRNPAWEDVEKNRERIKAIASKVGYGERILYDGIERWGGGGERVGEEEDQHLGMN